MKRAKTKELPSQSLLLSRLLYDEDTGILRWKVDIYHNTKAGSIAGGTGTRGYKHVTIDGLAYSQHRIIWKMINGSDPIDIDHINRIKTDNRICNLRQVSKSTNQHNKGIDKSNTSKIRGVCLNKVTNKWLARICVNRKRSNLGYFHCKALAGITIMIERARLIKQGEMI